MSHCAGSTALHILAQPECQWEPRARCRSVSHKPFEAHQTGLLISGPSTGKFAIRSYTAHLPGLEPVGVHVCCSIPATALGRLPKGIETSVAIGSHPRAATCTATVPCVRTALPPAGVEEASRWQEAKSPTTPIQRQLPIAPSPRQPLHCLHAQFPRMPSSFPRRREPRIPAPRRR